MLDDLKAWEANRPEEAPEILVVSTGTIETNRALGLRSPVLLDENSAAAHAFGASGTPMAVLVDEQGRIASDVAAGAAAVLALARGRRAFAASAHERDRARPVKDFSQRSRPPYSSSVTRGSRFQEGVVLIGVQVPTPTT